MMEIKSTLTLLALPLLLAGCATPEGSYPSLAIRDGERMTGMMQPVEVRPEAPPATPGAVLDRLTQLAGQAQQAHSAFMAEEAKARQAIVRGLALETGSDGRAAGEVALASLEASRNTALIALADLDRLYADAVTNGDESVRIEAVRNEVLALIRLEDDMLAAVRKGEI